MKIDKIFGYELKDNKLVPHPIESQIVKYLFKKIEEYGKNPPEELVEGVMEEYENNGKIITYEEAKQKVSYDSIVWLVRGEILDKWSDYFAEKKKILYKVVPDSSKIQGSPVCPIIGAEQWEKVKVAISKRETIHKTMPWVR